MEHVFFSGCPLLLSIKFLEFIPVFLCISSSFFFGLSIPLLDICGFFFQVLGSMIKAAINMLVQILYGYMFSFG